MSQVVLAGGLGLLFAYRDYNMVCMERGTDIKKTELFENRYFYVGKAGDLPQFERLLSEVSTRYINMPVEEIEKTIRNDFGRLAALLGSDSSYFHLFDQEKQNWMTQFELSEKVFMWVRREEFAEQLKKLRSQPDFGEKMQYMYERWDRGKYTMCPRPGKHSKKAEKMERFVFDHGISSFVSVPIFAAGMKMGAMIISTFNRNVVWPGDIVAKLQLFGELFVNALVRKRSEESLRRALSEVKQLKDQIQADYIYLTEEINLEHGIPDMVGNSQTFQQTLVKVKQVAPTNATVLLLGETGTGKGHIARAIHNASTRNQRPLIQVNCAALAPTLIESELFGHEKGAFTGAHSRKIGRFETANGTTLFLDEIGELSLDLQAKFLQVLQDGQFQRVGGTTTIKTDVRVIVATNRDLEKEVDEGRFRRDLWYRLNVFPIHISPLRERPEDIPLFVNYFVKKYQHLVGRKFVKVSQKSMNALENYSWPGNIRELENLIERAVITSTSANLQIEIPRNSISMHFSARQTLADVEKAHIIRTLEETGWVIDGPFGAARRLGLNHATFRFRMKKLQITRPTPAPNARRNPVIS